MILVEFNPKKKKNQKTSNMLAFLTTEGIFMVSFMFILKLNPKK